MMEVNTNLAHLAVDSGDYETARCMISALGEDCGSLELLMKMDMMNIWWIITSLVLKCNFVIIFTID